MSFEKELTARSGAVCELCGATNDLKGLEVAPVRHDSADDHVLACSACLEQITDPTKTDANHWRCLNDSMWSQVPAVQVLAWRMLNRIKGEGWPQDLLDMLYLDDDTLAWAKASGEEADEDAVRHIDSNGNVLSNGDTVVLIKDLNVKGGGFTAKRGTAVRGIRLDPDNAEYIEGKVEGQQIVILTQYVKKSN
ncbi:MAG: PhnA domain-containing protein [Breznakibacter sp.]